MSLLALQSAFRDEIAGDDDGHAPSSSGMVIYRDAYRGRLLAALETSFERTRRWTGAEAFTAAACHYILTTPPKSWTLDDYGADFPELLAQLFAGDSEVAELAWLEWQMQRAFAAPDAPELSPDMLRSADLSDGDWDSLCFGMAAGFACRQVTTNCTELWLALAAAPADNPLDGFVPRQTEAASLLVWRQGLMPHFRLTDMAEHQALGELAAGSPFGQAAAHIEPSLLGGWLARWLGDGLFSSYSISRR